MLDLDFMLFKKKKLSSCLPAVFTILEEKIRNTCDHQYDMLDRVEGAIGEGWWDVC